MKRGSRLKIRTKLVLLFTILFGFITLALYFYIPTKVEVLTLFSLIDRTRVVDEITSIALARGVETQNNEALKDVMEKTKQNTELLYAVVTDSSGKVLISNYQTPGDTVRNILITSPSLISSDGLMLSTYTPIGVHGRTLGSLYAGYSLQAFRWEIQSIRFLIVIASLIIYLIGVGVVSSMAVIATKPLKDIELLASQFRQQELIDPSAPVMKDAPNVNQVIDQLDFVQNTLDTINKELERRIETRTKQLVGEIETRRLVEDQLHKLSIRLQSVREEERSWISREIHDELGQALTGLKMYITGVLFALKESTDAALAGKLTDKLQSMASLVDTTITTTQKIVAELRPPILDKVGLVAGIEWYVKQFVERTDVHCEFISAIKDEEIPKEFATPLFRIVQETLTNVARHAGASEVTVSLGASPGILTLDIHDNGKGISDAEIHSMNSLGLLGIQERIVPLRGNVTISGNPGKGTSVTVRVPMNQTVLTNNGIHPA